MTQRCKDHMKLHFSPTSTTAAALVWPVAAFIFASTLVRYTWAEECRHMKDNEQLSLQIIEQNGVSLHMNAYQLVYSKWLVCEILCLPWFESNPGNCNTSCDLLFQLLWAFYNSLRLARQCRRFAQDTNWDSMRERATFESLRAQQDLTLLPTCIMWQISKLLCNSLPGCDMKPTQSYLYCM